MVNYFLITIIFMAILIYGLGFWYRSQRKKCEAFTKAILKQSQLCLMTASFQAHIDKIHAADRPKNEKHKAVNDAMKAFGREIKNLEVQ